VIRITSGEFRGRNLKTPPGASTRPTQARLRQALFNSLQAVLPEASVLDLFAGSGALSFEALSRGAARAVAVESHRTAQELIRENARTLRCPERIRVLGGEVDRLWDSILAAGPFDLVIADPPYSGGHELKLLGIPHWPRLLTEGGIFCLEWGRQKSQVEELPEETPFLVKVREKTYGDSVLSTYRLKSEIPSSS
jgi:16S rRNA (guanine966-N2)-methyltransferase